ncbi:alpha/beta hydrolase [Solibacillus sp. A46]|uniref:Alpha/beta hydrolase n=1 Tax=Solibacillus faecavium TaxID=2762221 RepID=A0ABR8XXR9_9BACL|nr:alpha/beta hydrolase [Solibacillus faecavium]MBD8036713.1 alpha/beta hydrolase [Solibacillus faecavium]
MWEQKLIETTRGTFEYFVKGSGQPLAITHFYSAFNEKGSWFANPFTEHYQVFLINVRGAGNSDGIEADEQMTLEEIILDLEAIREALHISKWAFSGHSTGGMLALQYAVLKQQSLTKCICGSSAASKAYAAHPNSIYCMENKNFNRIIEIMESLNDPNTPQEIRKKLDFEWALMSFTSEENLKQALTIPNSGRTVGRALDYFRKVAVKSFDLRKELPTIDVDTYVFGGKYDAQCPVEFSVEIAELIPNAELTIFEQSNHFPFVEEEKVFKDFVEETTKTLKHV